MNLEVFKNNGVELRVLGTTDIPLFVAKDVCNALGLTNVSEALSRLDEDELTSEKMMSGGQMRYMRLVNESGLYALILRSNKPQAKQFRKWVTSVVLPSIRRTGSYMSEVPQTFSEALMLAAKQAKQIEDQQRLIEAQKPAVLFAETVKGSSNSILIREFAKILQKDGFKIGERRLYQWLRDNKYLMQNNEPYQNYIGMGLFEVIERTIGNADSTITVHTTKITGKGQIYFAKKIK